MTFIPLGRKTMKIFGNLTAWVLLMVLSAACDRSSATNQSSALPQFVCPEGLFVFGASIADTGNIQAAVPFYTEPESPPYGSAFFGRPARRYSNGRVFTDFLTQAFRIPLLTPYLRSIAPDFRRGVNFAVSGAPILLSSIRQVVFYFGFQQAQFIRFKQNSLQVQAQAPEFGGISTTFAELLPTQEIFDKGLYTLRFGPLNDIAALILSGNLTAAQVEQIYPPKLAAAIAAGIQNLYDSGARTILVSNSARSGCLPLFQTFYANDSSVARDRFGCIVPVNRISTAYNSLLLAAIQNLRRNLTDATILYFDIAAAQTIIFEFPETYGFAQEKLLVACCGRGGQFNFTGASITCGQQFVDEQNVTRTVGACADPSSSVNWDGVHDTEAFARLTAEFALQGQFLDPPINLKLVCDLDFSKFRGSNFTQTYPNTTLLT